MDQRLFCEFLFETFRQFVLVTGTVAILSIGMWLIYMPKEPRRGFYRIFCSLCFLALLTLEGVRWHAGGPPPDPETTRKLTLVSENLQAISDGLVSVIPWLIGFCAVMQVFAFWMARRRKARAEGQEVHDKDSAIASHQENEIDLQPQDRKGERL